MLAIGAGSAVLCGISIAVAARASGAIFVAAMIAAEVAVVAALYGFGMAAYMTYSSRVGKLRTREALLDVAGALAPWTGREDVLDVGCGRGLLLVAAARRLTTGTAHGIDVWREEDQSANTADAALENARLEGVADRVRVKTADARELPFPAASFDVVLSHWVVHNLPDAAGRMRAIDEMLRVLRPGGVLVLADIAHVAAYRDALAARGIMEMRFLDGGVKSRIMGVLSGGTFRPQAIIALGNRINAS